MRISLRRSLIACTAAAAVLAVPASAEAVRSAPNYGCRNGYICLYEGANGKGKHYEFQWGATDLHDLDFANMASSFDNKNDQKWCAYDQAHYRGAHVVLGKGAGNIYPGMDDRIESLKPC